LRFVDLARALVLGAGVVAGACGEGLVPGDAYSSPLIAFGGEITPTGQLSGAWRPRVGVLWTDLNQVGPDLPSDSTYVSSHLDLDMVVDRYMAEIFRPPPAAAFVDIAADSGEVVRLALGELVIFDDRDGDGRFSVSGPRAEITPPDVFLAGAWDMVRYVSSPFTSPQSGFPLGMATTTGYALLTLYCAAPLLDPTRPARESLGNSNVSMTVLTSSVLPEVRTCAHSHSP